MGAVARQAAFEKCEFINLERVGFESGMPNFEIPCCLGTTAAVAGHRNVRVEGAALRLEAASDAGTVDLRR